MNREKYTVIGNHPRVIEACKDAYATMGYEEVLLDEKDTEAPDVLCVVSYFMLGERTVSSSVEYEKIEKLMRKMKSRSGGRCVLVINHLDEHLSLPEKAHIYREQAGLVKWWKTMAIELGKERISANIINIGYLSFAEEKSSDFMREELMKWMVVKRDGRKEDLFYALKHLSQGRREYFTGYELKLNGGISMNPLKPVMENSLHLVEVKDSIKGSTVLVIGSSSGIGEKAALDLAEKGANLILFARRVEKLEKIKEDAEKMGVHVEIRGVDVTETEELVAGIKQVYERNHGIDSIVYTAGFFDGENILKSFEKWEKSWKTNMMGFAHSVSAYVRCCKAFNRRGTVVGVVSIGGLKAILPHLEAYGVSKAAMFQFIRLIAYGYSKYGIRINGVAPGWISTPMTEFLTQEYMDYWYGKMCVPYPGTPEDISNAIRYLVSDESAYITGETMCVDGGVLLGKVK